MRNSRSRKPISIPLQDLKLRACFPSFRLHSRLGLWFGTLQPTSWSAESLIKIAWRPDEPPKVWVVTPELHPDARDLHRYPDGSLCLYHPADGSWRSDAFLAETVVPWTAEWLLYYEAWFHDAERRWLGPEAPHGT